MSDMQSAASTGSSDLTEVSAMSAAELVVVVRSQAEKIAALEHQLEWFRRQLFGQKSERFAPEPDPSQMHLGEVFPGAGATDRETPEHPSPYPTRYTDGWRRERRGAEVLRRVEGSRPDDHSDARRRRGPLARPVRGDRREGDLPDCPAPGQLSDPQVPPAGGQTQEQRPDPRPAGTRGDPGGRAARM